MLPSSNYIVDQTGNQCYVLCRFGAWDDSSSFRSGSTAKHIHIQNITLQVELEHWGRNRSIMLLTMPWLHTSLCQQNWVNLPRMSKNMQHLRHVSIEVWQQIKMIFHIFFGYIQYDKGWIYGKFNVRITLPQLAPSLALQCHINFDDVIDRTWPISYGTKNMACHMILHITDFLVFINIIIISICPQWTL